MFTDFYALLHFYTLMYLLLQMLKMFYLRQFYKKLGQYRFIVGNCLLVNLLNSLDILVGFKFEIKKCFVMLRFILTRRRLSTLKYHRK